MSTVLRDNEIFTSAISIFNLKRVKASIGHDKQGLYCDLCLKSKILISFEDDGLNGQTVHNFTSKDDEKYLEKFITDNKLAQLIFEKDNDSELFDSVAAVRVDVVLDNIINVLYMLKEDEKLKKKLGKQCDKSIVVGVNAFSYAFYGWTKIKSMSEILTSKNGLAAIQSTYDTAVKDLKAGEKILNSDEQLLGLGIKLVKTK